MSLDNADTPQTIKGIGDSPNGGPVFAEEKLTAIIPEIEPLIKKHYEEISANKQFPLAPCWGEYSALEEVGYLKTYTARKHGQLVGYNIFFFKSHIHYATFKTAQNDVLFIHPEHRGFGKMFIDWCDMKLELAGADAVFYHVKMKHDFGHALESLGHKPVEKIYMKFTSGEGK